MNSGPPKAVSSGSSSEPSSMGVRKSMFWKSPSSSSSLMSSIPSRPRKSVIHEGPSHVLHLLGFPFINSSWIFYPQLCSVIDRVRALVKILSYCF
jgi:hypothetical protein